MESEKLGELVVHAPPLNIICLLLLPFYVFEEKWSLMFTRFFSLCIFWIENIIGIGFFVILEAAMFLPVFCKTLLNFA